MTPSSLAWPMIQAARRFETRLAVVCLIGLHLLPLSSSLGLAFGTLHFGTLHFYCAKHKEFKALCLDGAALWVELSHPKKVDFVEKDCWCERRGGSCSASL